MPKPVSFVGKINKEELKDFGKGKGAEADEVLVVSGKLDGEKVRGGIFFESDEENPFQIGDVIEVTVSIKQGRLGLTGGGRRRAAAANED